MKILALEHDCPVDAMKENASATTQQYTALLKAEAKHTWELYQAGTLRELYFRQDQHSAVLILECGDLQQAEAVLQSLPLVQAGQIQFEVMVLEPYPGFGRLFS